MPAENSGWSEQSLTSDEIPDQIDGECGVFVREVVAGPLNSRGFTVRVDRRDSLIVVGDVHFAVFGLGHQGWAGDLATQFVLFVLGGLRLPGISDRLHRHC